MAGRDMKQEEAKFEQLVAQLGDKIATGLTKGVEEAGLFQRLVELLQNLQGRLEELEDRVAELKTQAQPQEQAQPQAPAKPQAQAPAKPPAQVQLKADAKSLSEVSKAFGLPMPSESSRSNSTSTPLRGRKRSRNPSRPTVIYRNSQVSSVFKEEKAVFKEEDGVCSEPGCDRPVRCRGMCSLHYQRVRYKERKTETKVESTGLPPLPPPPRAASSRKREGGTKGVFAMLYEDRGRKVISGYVNQIKFDRSDLVQRLNEHFEGLPGVPLEEEDVLRAVHYHKLGEILREREGEILCRNLSKQRGSLVKAAQKMKLPFDQLRVRIADLKMDDEVERIRNGFRETIMEQSTFLERLDLALTREKYLVDLDIVEEVDKSLQKELVEKLATLEDLDLQAQEQALRESFGLDEQRYRRLVRRYGDIEPMAALKAAFAEGSE